jgi:hypothetical protein
MIRRRMWFLFLLAAAAFCAACDQLCELVGCTGGLWVQLEGSLPDSFTVEVLVEENVLRAQHFANAGDDRGAFFRDFYPEEVTIRVSWATASVTASAQPDYRKWRPNGPDCPPECRMAEVVVDLTHRRRHVLPLEN